MRARPLLPIFSVVLVSGCPHPSSSSGIPAPSTSGSSSPQAGTDAGALAGVTGADAASEAGVPDDEWIGAVGGHPIHATLAVTPTSIRGRWFYEAHGAASGLAVECSSKTSPLKTCDGNETGDKNAVTGKIHLERAGASFVGSWEKPGGSDQLGVELSPVVRSRGADHVITARRIMQKAGSSPQSGALFVPSVQGAASARIAPVLTLKALLDENEKDLTGDGSGVTGLDFDVLRDDDRFLTIHIEEQTMGAYPDSHGASASFDWSSGKRIGASAFLPEKKAAIVKLLNARVHDAWRAQKTALSKKKTASSSDCGPDIAENFMDGDGPSFTAKELDTVFVTKTGIDFAFDFAFPHAVRACAPEVDLALPASDAKPFVDPKGPLGSLP